MKKTANQYLCTLAWGLAATLALCASCIGDDDEDQPQPPADDTPTVITDSTTVVVDSAYRATPEYMTGEWMAAYVGYDPQQSMASGTDVISAIRRVVTFAPDGSYDSHVQGIVNSEDTITTYKEFEHEHGTFAIDVEQQLMSYTVEYDSLLNFMTDELEIHHGKVVGPTTMGTYSERLYFSEEKEGLRDWVRTDGNLMSPDDHSAKLIYIMKKER